MFQDSEDPEVVVGRNQSVNLLIVTSKEEVLLFCGRNLVCRKPPEDLLVIFITYLAMYYILDTDYLASHEIAFTIMQFILFDDKKTPPDLIKVLDAIWQEYMSFKDQH